MEIEDKHKKPEGFEDLLGEYKVCFWDGNCGEPIAWGFPIIKKPSYERLRELGTNRELQWGYGYSYNGFGTNLYLITKKLSVSEAIEKYGAVTKLYRNTIGGFSGIQFGHTRFISRHMNPTLEEAKNIDESLVEKVEI